MALGRRLRRAEGRRVPGRGAAFGKAVARHLRGDLREIGRRQLRPFGEHHGPEDGVFELADIARPVIGRQQRQRAGRYGERSGELLFPAKRCTKARTRTGMSSLRRRSAGMVIGKTLRR